MTAPAVDVAGLSKTYSTTLLRLAALVVRVLPFAPIPAGQIGRRASVRALDGVSFSLQPGEVVGVVGANGAGKSTLLRLLAGVAEPTRGVVRVRGRVNAILDISTGLVLERSGRENVRHLGALYGLDARELGAQEADVLEVAGLGAFIDLPVRTYSAGMRARLAFAVATAARPDVLLVDEALSVGDAGFAARCRARLRALCAAGVTVVMVSHDLHALAALCQRVLWLDRGVLRGDGPPAATIAAYRAHRRETAAKALGPRGAARVAARPDGPLAAVACRLEDLDGHPVAVVQPGEALVAVLEGEARGPVSARARLEVAREDGLVVATTTCDQVSIGPGPFRLEADLGAQRFGPFSFLVRLGLEDAGAPDVASLIAGEAPFAVEDHAHAYRPTWFAPITWRLVPCAEARP